LTLDKELPAAVVAAGELYVGEQVFDLSTAAFENVDNERFRYVWTAVVQAGDNPPELWSIRESTRVWIFTDALDVDDCTGNHRTRCRLQVRGSDMGTIETGPGTVCTAPQPSNDDGTACVDPKLDSDFWSVELEGGRTYVIEVQGEQSGNGTLLDPRAALLRHGIKVAKNDNCCPDTDRNGPSTRDSRMTYTVPRGAGGTHYLMVDTHEVIYHGSPKIVTNRGGTYRVSVDYLTAWSTILTSGSGGLYDGFCDSNDDGKCWHDTSVDPFGRLGDTDFQIGDTLYAIQRLWTNMSEDELVLSLNRSLPAALKARLVLELEFSNAPYLRQFPFAEARGNGATYRWDLPDDAGFIDVTDGAIVRLIY